MSTCQYCGEEPKYLFLCSKCGGKYCKEHRSQLEHECRELQSNMISEGSQETQKTQIKLPMNANKVETEINHEETIAITEHVDEIELMETENKINKTHSIVEISQKEVMSKFSMIFKNINMNLVLMLLVGLTFGLVLASISGFLNNDNQLEYEALKENYNVIQKNYGEILTNMSVIETLHEDLERERNSIERELELTKEVLDKKNGDYNMLLDDYKELTNDWVDLSQEFVISTEMATKWNIYLNSKLNNSDIPSINQLETWIKADETDKLIENRSLLDIHIPLILSLKAREKHWKIGLIIISAKSSVGEDLIIPINVITTTSGVVYIDPKRDNIWWYPEYAEIIPGETVEIGDIKTVNVLKLESILEY